jgi:hypothetical protein
MSENLNDITKPDKLNLILFGDLGSTMCVCGLKSAIEKKYGHPIHFIIVKATHKVIMDMYGITDYIIYPFTNDELKHISNNNYHPQKGRLFVVNLHNSDLITFIKILMTYLSRGQILVKVNLQYFNLKKDTVFVKPLWYPKINDDISARFPNMDNTVLFLPESRSSVTLGHDFWKNFAEKLRKQGYTVVQSYASEYFRIEGIEALPDDLESIIAFAASCAAVYSVRNGLCDLIAENVRHLTVFYATKRVFHHWRIDGKNVVNKLINANETFDKKERKDFLSRKWKTRFKFINLIIVSGKEALKRVVKQITWQSKK